MGGMKHRSPITASLAGLCVLVSLGACAAQPQQARPEMQAAAPPSGSRLYLDCAACHGADGGGVADGTIPAIGGQPAAFIISALEDFRSGRRADLRMRHFADPQHLADRAEVEAVAAYAASLRRRTPPAHGDGLLLALGGSLFADHCVQCHGERADGADHPLRPALAGQHAPYLRRKLREARAMTVSQARQHSVLADRIGEEGIAALADWLSRLPGP